MESEHVYNMQNLNGGITENYQQQVNKNDKLEPLQNLITNGQAIPQLPEVIIQTNDIRKLTTNIYLEKRLMKSSPTIPSHSTPTKSKDKENRTYTEHK